MKNNAQILFFKQLLIAVVTFAIAYFVVLKLFYNSPKVNEYLSINEGVKAMSNNSRIVIDSLKSIDQLTSDPSGGKLIEEVLVNLSTSDREKLLMIGSSQLRVAKDRNDISGFFEVVSNQIEKQLENDITVYNLSIGGMSTSEKIIVAEKAMEKESFDNVLISLTPWDLNKISTRDYVEALKSLKLSKTVKSKTKKEDQDLETQKDSTKVFPLNVNEEIERIAEKQLNKTDLFSKKTAIKYWLNDDLFGPDSTSGSSSKEKGLGLPLNWITLRQKLDNKSGWDTISKTGERSIKIVNTDSSNAIWQGKEIQLTKPTTTLTLSGWSKSKLAAETTKLYCLDFKVLFEDGSHQWYVKNLDFPKGTNDWNKAETKVNFNKQIVAVIPHVLFYGGSGEVWFDDLGIFPHYEGEQPKNIMINPGFEKEVTERDNVKYSYNDDEWKVIYNNAQKLIDFLSDISKDTKTSLLLTPHWYKDDRTAYPQIEKYQAFVNFLKKECESKNVYFSDASTLLKDVNFGHYTKGNYKDKIDVLHFTINGHKELAKFLINDLKLEN